MAPSSKPSDRNGYRQRRLMLIGRGEWQPFVPAREAVRHIDRIKAETGWSDAQFSAASGVSRRTIRFIRQGKPVKPVTLRKILAVTVAAEPGAGWVDATGARRRLQALTAAGWSGRALAARIGADGHRLRQIRDGHVTRIQTPTARKIAAVYAALWCTPPEAVTAEQRKSVTRARNDAERAGFAPAAAWDDDIDDPAAEPHWDWVRRDDGARRHAKGPELAEDLRDLMRAGLSRGDAAARLGITKDYADKILSRYPQADKEAA